MKAGRAAPPAAADLVAATRMTEATATATPAVAVAQPAAAAVVADTTRGQRRGNNRLVHGEATARLERRRRGDN